MREIKFRAWDIKSKIMAFVETLHLGKKTKPQIENCEWDWYKRDYKLMQYTGLKDVNGVEIYESDVVALLVISTITVKLEIAMVDGVFSVINIPKGYGFRDTKYRLDELVGQGRIEVIGNIYENKELLEEK